MHFLLLENTKNFIEENRKLLLTPPPKEINCDISPSCIFSVHKCKPFTKQRPSSILLLLLLTNISETFYISLKYFCDDYLKWHHKIFKCVFTIIIWWKGKERWSLSFCESQNSAVWPIRYPFPLVPAKRKETTTASSFCQKGKWPFHWGCSASWAAQQAAGRSSLKMSSQGPVLLLHSCA